MEHPNFPVVFVQVLTSIIMRNQPLETPREGRRSNGKPTWPVDWRSNARPTIILGHSDAIEPHLVVLAVLYTLSVTLSRTNVQHLAPQRQGRPDRITGKSCQGQSSTTCVVSGVDSILLWLGIMFLLFFELREWFQF